MADPVFDLQRYTELLARTAPAVIETPEEHERLLGCAEELMDKGESLAPEERRLLELLVLLIEVFEREVEEADGEAGDTGEAEEIPEPHETLRRLLTGRGWDPIVLNDALGNPKLVDDVLAGRRKISKGQAKELGKLFKVPSKLFIAD